MLSLFKFFFRICKLELGPEDLPASTILLLTLSLFYLGLSILTLWMSYDLIRSMSQALVEFLLITGISWLVLTISGHASRFMQTVIALIGTEALISLFALPALIPFFYQSGYIFIYFIVLIIWQWLVCGHIFCRALDRSFLFGLGVSFMYIFTSYQVIGGLYQVTA